MALVSQAYNVDFNAGIDTSDPSFKAAPGWKHLVDKGAYSSQKVSYSYIADGGVDGSGCLSVGEQSYFDYFDYKDIILNDMLVTPAVSGKVSIDVKKASTGNGSIKFYKLTEVNGTLVRGEEIPFTDPGLVSFEFTTIELTGLTDATMIGIRAENVLLDNFFAENADVVLSRSLSIESVVAGTTANTIDCNSDNEFEVKATVKVKNNGEVELTTDSEGYVLQLALMKKDAAGNFVVDQILKSVDIPQSLTIGETSNEIVISAMVSETTLQPEEGATDKAHRYDIIECVSNTSKLLHNYTPVPYRPIPVICDPEGKEIEKAEGYNFGIVSGVATRKLTLRNDGAAEMKITAISSNSEDFTCNATTPLTVEKHSSKDIEITLSSSVYGTKSGVLTLSGDGFETVEVALKGEVLDPTMWFCNFETGTLPQNMINKGNWTIDNKLVSGDNKFYATCTNLEAGNMLISPKLVVSEGEKLTLDAAQTYGDASFVKIYYSSDRSNWTLLRTLSASAENDADRLTDEYTGTKWGANTKYNFTQFEINNIPAGEYYVGFESGNARIDNLLGYHLADVEHDAFVTTFSAPTVGMVNNKLTVTATLSNLTSTTEAEGSFFAKLFIGDNEIEGEGFELPAYGEVPVTFTYTPHETGTLPIYVAFENDTFTAKSDVAQITIGEESASTELKIGKSDAADATRGSSAPLALYYKKSDSESIYLANQLGIKAGTKITRIAFHGKGSSEKDVTANLKVLIENTSDTAPIDIVLNETKINAMTEVFNDSYIYHVKKTSSEVVAVDLSTPFTYTGENLRIVVMSESTTYQTTYFECDKDVSGQSVYRGNDKTLPTTTTKSLLPTLYLGVTVESPVLSGKVTDENGNAVEGAKVILTCDDVLYQGTTDTEGNYSITIVQSSLTYNMEVTADGYEAYNDEVQLTDGGSTQANVTLKNNATGIETLNNNNDHSDIIYDLSGRRVSKPAKGIYIKNGKKILVR